MSTLVSKLIVALVDQVTAPSRAISAAINRMTAAQDRNNQRLDQVRGRMVEAGAVAYGFARALAAPISAATAWENSMLGVAKQLDGARDTAGNLTPAYYEMGKEIQKLGRVTPIATNDLAEMVTAGLRMGVAKDEVLQFVQETAKMSTAFEMPAAELADSMGKIAGLYKIPVPAISELADTINYLDDNTISTGSGIIEYLTRVGGVAGAVKISSKDMAAFGSTLLSLGERTETAGTATNAMIQKFAAATKGTKKFHSAMKEIGLAPEAIQKGMQQDAFETMLTVMDAVNRLPSTDRIGVLTELVGLEHADTLAKLATQTAELRRQRDLANSSAAKGSMDREYQARLETTSAQWEIAKNRATELGVAIGSALLPALNELMGRLGPILTKMAEWADRHPALMRAVVGVAAALVGLRVAAVAAQFGFLWMRGGLIAGAIGGLRALSAVGRVASVALLPVTAAFKGLRRAMVGYAAAAAVGGRGAGLAAMGKGLLGLLNPLRLVTVALRILKVALIGTGIGAILAGIAMAGAWIYNNWTGITVAFEAFKGAFLRAIAPIMPALQPVGEGLSWLWEKVSGLLGPIDALGGGWARAGLAAGKFVGEALTTVVGFTTNLVASITNAWRTMSWAEIGQAAARGICDGFLFLARWMADLLGAIDWRALWDGAVGAAATVAGWIASAFSMIDWSGLASGASNAISGLYNLAADTILSVDWGNLGFRLGEMIAAGISAILNIGRVILASLTGGVTSGAEGIGSAIASGILAFDWAGVGSAILRYIGAALNAGGEFVRGLFGALSSIDWTGLISGASAAISGLYNLAADTLLSVDWGSLGFRLGEMIAAGISGILNIGRIILNSMTGGGASTGDYASVATAIGSAIASGILAFDWIGVGSALLRYIGAGMLAVGEFMVGLIGGLIGVDDLKGAGIAMAKSMCDGVMAKIDEMVEWFKGLPGRIVAAIGSIDLGSMIDWPKPPAWLSRMWGGGQEEAAPAPIANEGGGNDRPSGINVQALAANDNAQEAVNAMLDGMERLAGGVTREGAAAVSAANKVGSAISDNIAITATPVIDTSSIDAARSRVEALSRSLQSMPSTAITATSSALAGARASGGPVKAGGAYLVGEQGPEIVTFGRDGFVHDAMKTARIIRNAALASAGMALPAAAMPAFEMPELPRIELRLPEIPPPSVTLPEVRMPAVPQIDWPQNEVDQREGGRRDGTRVEIQIANGAITVHAAAGQSPERVAEEVERRLTARLNALSRGAFSDGAN